MTAPFKHIAERTERESRDDYPAVIGKLSDGWRLIVADLEGCPEIELQSLEGDTWVRFIGESVEHMGELLEAYGLPSVSTGTH